MCDPALHWCSSASGLNVTRCHQSARLHVLHVSVQSSITLTANPQFLKCQESLCRLLTKRHFAKCKTPHVHVMGKHITIWGLSSIVRNKTKKTNKTGKNFIPPEKCSIIKKLIWFKKTFLDLFGVNDFFSTIAHFLYRWCGRMSQC